MIYHIYIYYIYDRPHRIYCRGGTCNGSSRESTLLLGEWSVSPPGERLSQGAQYGLIKEDGLSYIGIFNMIEGILLN